MSTEAEPLDIGSNAEVAAALGVSKQTVWNWMNRPGWNFPAPIVRLAMGPIWNMEEVRTWSSERNKGK